MSAPPRILIVDDDDEASAGLGDYLRANLFEVERAGSGVTGLAAIAARTPDLVVLDVNMPGMTGLEVCRRARARWPDLPVIFLTGLDSPFDELVGLELGADDYVAKPAEPRLLLARIRAVLRRSRRQGPAALRIGPLAIDEARRQVTVEGAPVQLTDAEFDLLLFMAQRAGEILDRDTLYRELRGIEYDGLDRTLDLRISRLRKKLGDRGALLRSVRGRGYLLAPP